MVYINDKEVSEKKLKRMSKRIVENTETIENKVIVVKIKKK